GSGRDGGGFRRPGGRARDVGDASARSHGGRSPHADRGPRPHRRVHEPSRAHRLDRGAPRHRGAEPAAHGDRGGIRTVRRSSPGRQFDHGPEAEPDGLGERYEPRSARARLRLAAAREHGPVARTGPCELGERAHRPPPRHRAHRRPVDEADRGLPRPARRRAEDGRRDRALRWGRDDREPDARAHYEGARPVHGPRASPDPDQRRSEGAPARRARQGPSGGPSPPFAGGGRQPPRPVDLRPRGGGQDRPHPRGARPAPRAMTEPPFAWTASVRVAVENPTVLDWLEQALRPEASREVPRAQAEMRRGPGGSLEITISARDSGAMRAALNTYLGWIHLSLATARAVDRSR